MIFKHLLLLAAEFINALSMVSAPISPFLTALSTRSDEFSLDLAVGVDG
jgi:hypothetical protein